MAAESVQAPTRPEVLEFALDYTAAALDTGASVDRTQLSEETALVGSGAVVDSLGLVQIISDVEDAIADQYGRSIDLTDERALSQTSSPFRTIGTMVDHVMTCLEVSSPL